jgi:hypothetical protein
MSKDKLLLMLRNDDTNANDDQRTICVEEAGSCDRLQLNKLQVRDWQDNVNSSPQLADSKVAHCLSYLRPARLPGRSPVQ